MNYPSTTFFRTSVALVLLLEICAVNMFSADPSGSSNFVERPLTGVWSAASPMEYERYWFTATTLRAGT